MIRFVPIPDTNMFALFDTVVNKFWILDGSHAWETLADCLSDLEADENIGARPYWRARIESIVTGGLAEPSPSPSGDSRE